MLNIIISNYANKPLYQQIKEQIIDAILRGTLAEGEPLPSIRNLANDIKVSVLTIRRVYDELEQEGFTTSQVGVGTFVSTGNVELLRDFKRHTIERKMEELITMAKTLNITKAELIDMMGILYEEEG